MSVLVKQTDPLHVTKEEGDVSSVAWLLHVLSNQTLDIESMLDEERITSVNFQHLSTDESHVAPFLSFLLTDVCLPRPAHTSCEQ